jgi:hypothetical protein
MLAHNVYFALIDNSEVARQTLLDACHKYLVNHPGEMSFACGILAADHARPVNDRDWDVGLHIVFADKGAHDQYQASAAHNQFVAETRDNWKKARVFDTELA